MATATDPRPQQQGQTKPKTFAEEGEELLLAHGWTRTGRDQQGRPLWEDPRAKAQEDEPDEVKKVNLPGKDGGVTITEQKVGKILRWEHVFEDAVSIQRNRLEEPAILARRKKAQEEREAFFREQALKRRRK